MLNEPSVSELVEAVKPFFPELQLKVVIDHIFDSEHPDWMSTRAHYIGVLQSFKEIFEKMPKTYDTEPEESEDDDELDNPTSNAGDAIAYLHYFIGGCDWWITERDKEPEQLQFFGVADLGFGSPELGYISTVELLETRVQTPFGFMAGVELDFHWEPKALKDIPELKEKFSKYTD